MSEAKECTPLRRAIAIDFDGCLCKPGAWPGIGAPNWRVIEAALKERADGAALILWTCREGEMLQQALDACKGWGLEFDAVNESLPEWRERYGNDPRKIGASEYWDDRARPLSQCNESPDSSREKAAAETQFKHRRPFIEIGILFLRALCRAGAAQPANTK